MAEIKERKDITLKVDGEEICMMPFVENIAYDVIMGLVRNLKGYEEGKEVEIILK